MTSLTAEAAGFFSGRLCVRTGQYSPSDVTDGIDVGVDLLLAPPRSEYRSADTVARVEVAARVVHLTGMPALLEGCVVQLPVCHEVSAEGDVAPLNLPVTSPGGSAGFTGANVCTWPGDTLRAAIRQAFSAAISSSILFRRIAARPPRSPLGHFGHHRMCGPSDVTPPLQRRKRPSNMKGTTHGRAAKPTGRPGAAPCAPIPLTAEAAGPGGVV